MQTNQPSCALHSWGLSVTQPDVDQPGPLDEVRWDSSRESPAAETATRQKPSGDVLVPRVVMSIGWNGGDGASVCVGVWVPAGKGDWHPASNVAAARRVGMILRIVEKA